MRWWGQKIMNLLSPPDSSRSWLHYPMLTGCIFLLLSLKWTQPIIKGYNCTHFHMWELYWMFRHSDKKHKLCCCHYRLSRLSCILYRRCTSLYLQSVNGNEMTLPNMSWYNSTVIYLFNIHLHVRINDLLNFIMMHYDRQQQPNYEYCWISNSRIRLCLYIGYY